MELRQLRYFMVLAEELHFGRAAARLRIATPTLSQQIGALERSLQSKLFERTSRTVALTDSGVALLGEARHVLDSADRARAAVAGAGTPGARVTIRVTHGLEHVLTEELAWLQQWTDFKVDLSVSNGQDAEAAVRQGRADAALIWLPSHQDTRLGEIRLRSEAVWLALPSEHRLATKTAVPVEALAQEPIVMFPRHLSPALWDLYVGHLLPDGPTYLGQVLDEPTRLRPMDGMLAGVASGRGVCPFVLAVASGLSREGVVLRRLEPELTLPVTLIWRQPMAGAVRQVAAGLMSLRNQTSPRQPAPPSTPADRDTD
jgi:DNA-binding transcriptional LysR family regulator